MCGICGIIDQNRQHDAENRRSWVRAMNAAMRHRGPDEAGERFTEESALAMRRLSIIDLSTGQQPIYNEDRTVSVFFNGEIYNFPELRAQLEAAGHQFYTQSDTEVLVHLYEEVGFAEALKQLRGMFGLVLHDARINRYWLARDRFGEKPLFYYQSDGCLYFSSEIQSLLQTPVVPRKLDQEALAYYLRQTMIPEPRTLLAGVKSLRPGHFLSWKDGGWKEEAYFELQYKADPAIETEEDAMGLVEPLLEQAVRRQMISDVPLGAFLSGGIDSSTVVAWMQRHSDRPVKTFTVRFEESGYDESPVARAVANHLGTDHTEITVPNQDFTEDIFWMVIDQVGMPFPDSSAIPTYLISREIRKHVTVALSGDGGDELFGGYPIFQWWPRIARLQRTPVLLRRLAGAGLRFADQLPMGGATTRVRQLRRALEAADYKPEELGMAIQELFSPSELQALAGRPFRMPEPNKLASFPKAAAHWSHLRRAMYSRLTINLPLDMLVKVDRMSMANSLEVRAPFLDPDLFEASCRIPDRFLIQNGIGKHLIRQIMRDKLPDVVFNHPKTGFSIPLHEYQNDSYRKLAGDLFNARNPLYELFDPKGLQEILQAGLHTRTDTGHRSVYRTSHQLWSLMQLFGWAKRFGVDPQ